MLKARGLRGRRSLRRPFSIIPTMRRMSEMTAAERELVDEAVSAASKFGKPDLWAAVKSYLEGRWGRESLSLPGSETRDLFVSLGIIAGERPSKSSGMKSLF